MVSLNYLNFVGITGFLIGLPLSVIIIASGYKKKVNITLFLYSIFITFFCSILFFNFSTDNPESGLFWARCLNTSALLFPFLFILFIQALVDTLGKRNTTIFLSGLVSVGFFIYAILFPDNFVATVQQKGPFLYYAKAGPHYIFMPLMYFVLISLGIYESLCKRKDLTIIKRKQLDYVFAGLMIGFVFGCTLFFYVFDIPIYPFGTVGIVIMKLIFAYAILKTELLDIKNVISSSLAKWITLSLVLISFLVLYSITQKNYFVLPAIVLALFWAWWGRPLHQIIHEPIASKWMEGWYHSDKLLSDLAESLKHTQSNQEIASIICERLQEQIGLSHIDSYYKTETDFINLKNPTLSLNPEYIRYFQEAPELSKTLHISNTAEKLQYFVKNRHEDIRLICPLCNDSGLQILILIGPKKSQSPFSETDMATFNQIIRLMWFHFSLLNPLQSVQAELDQKEAHIRQIQDLASFGTLTKGIAHEIKNPLNMMYNSLQIILSHCKAHIKDPEILALSESTLKSTLRLNDTVKLMLKLGQENKLHLENIDIHEGLKNVLRLSKTHCKQQGIQTIEDFSYTDKILGNQTAIEQIFTNLLINSIEAIQAHSEEGSITIGTEHSLYKQNGITQNGVKVWIHDTGIGIEEDRQASIFKAFETSKYNNIGLGLSIVLQQVHLMNGMIDVSSKTGSTTFSLFFPSSLD